MSVTTTWSLTLSQAVARRDIEDAASLIVGWLEPVATSEDRLNVRAFTAGHYERLSAASAADLLGRARTPRKSRQGWTHCILLRAESGPADGMLWLRIGDDLPDVPGAALYLELGSETLALFEERFLRAIAGGMVSEGSLAPAALANGVVGVLTFTRKAIGPLPAGARATAVGGGVCIRACALSASQPEMREAIGAVAQALTGVAASASFERAPAPTHSAPFEVASPAMVAPFLAVAAPTPASKVDPDETAAIPVTFFPGAAVPFAGALPADRVAEMFDPVEPRPRPPEPGPDETALIPVAAFVMPKTGTFRDQLGPLVVPVLSLDEYAELRARLTVYGESHEPTLKRFGVAAREVHEAVRGRFSEYFLRDPSAQAQFLKAMQAAIGRVRAERDGSEK